MKEYNDYELLYMIHSGDDRALQYLLDKYENIARMSILRFINKKNYRSNFDDLMQLSRIKLLQAVDTYCEERGVPFFCFYSDVLEHTLVDYYRRYTYRGSKNLYFQYTNMDVYEGEQSYDVKQENAERAAETNRILRQRIRCAKKDLSVLEKRILDLRVQGYTYKQIADLLRINKKKVDNTLQKVRNAKERKR